MVFYFASLSLLVRCTYFLKFKNDLNLLFSELLYSLAFCFSCELVGHFIHCNSLDFEPSKNVAADAELIALNINY